MFEFFVYPVSAVMKLWHWMLHSLFGVDDSIAWVVSVFGLVITVRALIAPFSWSQKRSNRRAILMRPELAELNSRYATSTDPADVEALVDGTEAIHRKYNFQPLAGCVPPLIQIPVFLGLYRLLLWMARPETRNGESIGLLSSEELDSFLQARVGGVPVQAYISMPADELAQLGTTPEAVLSFALPLLLAACLFTAINMVISLVSSWRTMDWSSGVSRGVFNFILVLAILVPAIIFSFGYFGPAPVALILYWFSNNLWTIGQTAIINTVGARKWPEGEEHHAKRQQDRENLLAERRAEKQRRRETASRRREALAHPSRAQEIRAELAQKRAAAKAEKKEEKSARKQRSRKQTRIRNELRAKARQQKKEDAAAAKGAETETTEED